LNLVDAARLTVTVSTAALNSFKNSKENIQDMAFHVRMRRATVFDEGQYISAHSKIRSMHELWFSAGDLVMVPKEHAWTVCAQWTQLDMKTRHFIRSASNCADDLYESGTVLLGKASLQETVVSMENMDAAKRQSLETSILEKHHRKYTEIVDSQSTQTTQSEKSRSTSTPSSKSKARPTAHDEETKKVESQFSSELERTTWCVSQMSTTERRKVSTQVLESSLDAINQLSPLERQEMEALDDSGILRLEKHWMSTLQQNMANLKSSLGETETRDDVAVRQWEGHFASHSELVQRTESLREEYVGYLSEESRNRVESMQINKQLDALKTMLGHASNSQNDLRADLKTFQRTEIEDQLLLKGDLLSEMQQLDESSTRLKSQIQQEKMVLKQVESSMMEAGSTDGGNYQGAQWSASDRQ